jgi:hypothetical protein
MNTLKTLLLGAALGAALAGCKKDDEAVATAPPAPDLAPAPAATIPGPQPAPAVAPGEFSVADVVLGTVLGADGIVMSPANSFAPTDTIHATVVTKNPSSGATLAAKWMSEDGSTIHEESKAIAPTGDAVTDFQFQSSGGLAPGKYKVDISLNGQTINTLEFGIK